jgi:hypothetical protein
LQRAAQVASAATIMLAKINACKTNLRFAVVAAAALHAARANQGGSPCFVHS